MSPCSVAGACDGRRLPPASECRCRQGASPPADDLVVASTVLGAACFCRQGSRSMQPKEQALLGGADASMADGELLGKSSGASLGKGQTRIFGAGAYGLGMAGSQDASVPVQRPAAGSSDGLLPPPSACVFCMGGVKQGSEVFQQPPYCTPGVWGNAPAKNSAMQGDFEGSLSSKPQGGVPNPAWKRPQVFELPILEESDCFSIDDNSVRLDDEALQVNLKRFEAALVGRLFGKRIPFVHLHSELKRRWDVYGSFRLVMVCQNSFVCFFDNAAARDGVLAGGPWLLAGQVIGLDRWSPSFSPSSMVGYSTPVWVRLPGLPLQCWDKVNIARITSPIGLPLWIDAATNLLERGGYARACVKVDLSKPLKPGIWVHNSMGSFYQSVEYEGLPVTCFRCGLVGHKGATCISPSPSPGSQGAVRNRVDSVCSPVMEQIGKVRAADLSGAPSHLRSVDSAMDEAVQQAAPGSKDEAEQLDARGLGPWMLVQHRRSSRRAQSFANQQQPAKNAKWVAAGVLSAAHSLRAGHSQGLPKPSRRSGSSASPVAVVRPAAATSMAGSPQRRASPSPPPPPSIPPLQEGLVQPQVALDVGGEMQPGDGHVIMACDSSKLDSDQPLKNFQVVALDVGGVMQPGDGHVIMACASSKLDSDQPLNNFQVEDHSCGMVQQEDSGQTLFGGFSAMPSCSNGRDAHSGAAKRSAKQRRKALVGDKGAFALLPALSLGALEFVEGSPGPSMCDGTMVPYCKRLYVDELSPLDHEDVAPLMIEGCRDLVEGCKEEGHRSLKVERMLNDLGPIASLPRKRRLISLNLDGGDASPSLSS